jgi:putative FmdB family regulatory protein
VPTYQYACKECGHAFDQVQSFTDDTLTECPECDGRLRKVFNAVGVVFKGSGFYRTDSRGKASASETGSTSGESTSETSSGESKSESKTESKKDSKSGSNGDSSSGSSSSSSSSTSTKSPQPTAG